MARSRRFAVRDRRVVTRAAMVALGACVVGAVAFSVPAAADVTVTPSTGVRGAAAKLVFRVAEQRDAAHTTRIELHLPEATPIAEVYPMSVPDWVPTIATRKLDKPIGTIHGPSTAEVVSTITWTRVSDAAAPPGTAAELEVSVGPLPDVDRVAFTVVQTYSDGTIERWADLATGKPPPSHLAPVLSLGPASLEAGSQVVDDQASESAQSGLGFGFLGVALLIGVAVGVVLAEWRATGRALSANTLHDAAADGSKSSR